MKYFYFFLFLIFCVMGIRCLFKKIPQWRAKIRAIKMEKKRCRIFSNKG